jgi:hypothetical protein
LVEFEGLERLLEMMLDDTSYNDVGDGVVISM